MFELPGVYIENHKNGNVDHEGGDGDRTGTSTARDADEEDPFEL